MGTVNLHIVVGMVGQKPVLRMTSNGKNVAELSVCTQDGELVDGKPSGNWHKLICWGKTAEFAASYLDKGNLVCVHGSGVKLRNFTGRDGKQVYIKETMVDKIIPLSAIRKSDDNPSYQQTQAGNNFTQGVDKVGHGNIPTYEPPNQNNPVRTESPQPEGPPPGVDLTRAGQEHTQGNYQGQEPPAQQNMGNNPGFLPDPAGDPLPY